MFMVLTNLCDDVAIARIRFLVIDFEGLTPAGRAPEPIEVAAVRLDWRVPGDLVETARFESLIRPPTDVPVTWRDSAAGITPTMLAHARPASEVMAALDQLLPAPASPRAAWPYRLVAHHAATERTLIFGQREHCQVLAATPLLDTVRLARTALPGLAHHGLSEVARHLGLDIPANRHRAMPDAELTVAVLTGLLARGPWRSLHDLERDARLQPKRPKPAAAKQSTLF
jgi:DNA polymerase-3 subunit epsilon